jgi:hypothetical protein
MTLEIIAGLVIWGAAVVVYIAVAALLWLEKRDARAK